MGQHWNVLMLAVKLWSNFSVVTNFLESAHTFVRFDATLALVLDISLGVRSSREPK
jgi:hypothetical protein